MTATHRVRLTEIGWDKDLVFESNEQELTAPTGNQVLVEVEACGVCYRDIVDRDGRFKFIRIPITPGHELAGRVIAVGPQVDDWVVGDRVGTMHRDSCGQCPACKTGETSSCAMAAAVPGLIIDGGYASHFAAPQNGLFRLPDDLPPAEAAVMHCTFGTAFRGLRRRGKLEAGQCVLITGANGGVGTAAVQIGKRLGAHVIAVVRDEAHREFLSELGADQVIVDAGDKFHKQLGGRLADVAMDCVGPPTFNASLRSLRPGGRLIVVGNVVQDKAQLNLGYLVTRSLVIFGSAGANRADMSELLELHREQPFRVQIEEQLGLDQADRAQRRVRAGGLRGRIVLVPPSSV